MLDYLSLLRGVLFIVAADRVRCVLLLNPKAYQGMRQCSSVLVLPMFLGPRHPAAQFLEENSNPINCRAMCYKSYFAVATAAGQFFQPHHFNIFHISVYATLFWHACACSEFQKGRMTLIPMLCADIL